MNSIEGVAGAEGVNGLGNLGGLGGMAPLAGQGTFAGIGQASSLGTLAVPPTWAETVSSVAPLPALKPNVVAGAVGAVPSPAATAGISKLPLGAMVGRESDGAVHRIGLRPSLIPHSPVAG